MADKEKKSKKKGLNSIFDLFELLEKKAVKRWKKMKAKTDKFFMIMALCTVSIFGFLYYSRTIFSDDSTITDSGIGLVSKTQIKGTTIEIVARNYNAANGYGEVLFRFDQPALAVGNQFDAIAGEAKLKTMIETKFEQVSDQYYVLKMFNIPSKWQQIVIDVGVTSERKPELNQSLDTLDVTKLDEKKEQSNTEQVTFVMDYRSIESNSKAEEKEEEDYIIQYTLIEIGYIEKLMETNKESIEKTEKNFALLEQKIEKLEQEKKYQTEADQVKANSEIQSIQNNIIETKKLIDKTNETVTELQLKKEKLIERNHDAEQTKNLKKRE